MNKATTESVWTQFSDRLRGFIAKRVREDNDVQDILQDVFTKIHAGLGALKENARLEAWLFQVARRGILDYFRGHAGKRRSAELPGDVAAERVAEDVTGEVASWLLPLMSLIPEEDRETLRLTDLEGLSQVHLASKLGISVTGAKSRVQRARRRLREAVLDCCHIELDRRGNAIAYTPRHGRCRDCSCV